MRRGRLAFKLSDYRLGELAEQLPSLALRVADRAARPMTKL